MRPLYGRKGFRSTVVSPMASPGLGGESRLRSLLLLGILTVVAFLATYTTITAIYAPRPGGVGGGGGLLSNATTAASGGKTNSKGAGGAAAGAAGAQEDFCRGIPHWELWGDAVKWGNTNLAASAAACCAQCKSLCPEDRVDCSCNSWVYCGDKGECGESYKQCWLKKQHDVMKPEVHASDISTPWTSGVVHPKDQGIVALDLGPKHGQIRIKLHPTWAPRTVQYVKEVVALKHCTGCQLYRAEGLGEGWDAGGRRVAAKQPGPPYALLQGTLQTEGLRFKEIPREAAPAVRRAHVCLIGGGPDFFISLADHGEWGHAHTVFGEVLPADMGLVDKLAARPTKPEVWGEVQVQVLVEPLDLVVKRHVVQ